MRPVLIALAILLAGGVASEEEPPDLDDGIHLYEDILAEDNIRDLLRRARLEQGKDWDKALALYAQLRDKYGATLCPSANPRIYRRVDDRIREEMLSMPPEVLERYRLRADADAKRLLAKAAEDLDPEPARLAFERHGVSRLGRKAADVLGDLTLESGDVLAASAAWESALDDPGLGGEKDPLVLAKLALARARQGRLAEAKSLAARLPEALVLSLGGRDVPSTAFGAWLDQVRPEIPAGTPVDEWASVGGAASRITLASRVSAVEPKPWELRDLASQGTSASLHGAVSGGIFAVADASTLYLVDAATGKLKGKGLWGGKASGRGRVQPVQAYPRPFAVTVSGNLAYANLVRADDQDPAMLARGGWGMMQMTGPRCGLLAVEIDKEGKRRWKFPDGQDPETTSLDVRTSPVVVGDLVVAACTCMRTSSEVWLVGLGREDGRLRWKRFLCNSPVGEMGYAPAEPALAAEGGRVFCATQRGAVVAVEASTGKPVWAYRYAEPRAKPDANARRGGRGWMDPSMMTASLKPFSPPLVSGGVVYALPADGREVLALESSTGKPLWQRPVPEADQLLGMVAGRLVLTGGTKCLVLDAAPGGRLAQVPVPEGGAAGRGILTADSILVPNAKGIVRIDLGTLKLTGQVLAWPEGFSASPAASKPQPGRRANVPPPQGGVGANLLAFGGHLFAVGTRKALAFKAPSSQEPDLVGAVESSPQDPAPRLQLARHYRAENQASKSLAILREAWPMCREDTPCRKAVSEALLAALLDAGSEARRAGDPKASAELLKEAASLPLSPADEAALRLDLGRALAEAGDGAGALSELQTVLERLGEVQVARPASLRASVAAGREIALLSSADPALRARRDEAASKALRRAGRDGAALQAVADGFPDAPASGEALLELARMKLELDPDQGVRMLCSTASRAPGSASSLGALESLLDLASSRKDPAWEAGIVREIRRQLALTADPPKRLASRVRDLPDPPDPWAGQPFPLEESWTLVGNERTGLLAAPDAWAWANVLLLSTGQMVDASGGKIVWQPDDLKNPRPWMGVTYDGASSTLQHVRPGSQAERAGLKEGDQLQSFDGVAVNGNLPDVVSRLKPGQVVQVKILREGKPLTVPLQLARKPADSDLRFRWAAAQGPWILLGSPTEVCAYDAATRGLGWRLELEGASKAAATGEIPAEDPELESEVVWSEAEGRQTLATGDGASVVLDETGNLCGLDLARGERIWERRGEGFESPLTGAGPGEAACPRAAALHLVDRATGRSRVVIPLPGALTAPPLWGPDRLLVPCGRTLFAADPATGKAAWSAEGLPAEATAVFREGPVAAVLAGGKVEAFDAATGKPLWKLGLEGLSASGAALSEGLLAVTLRAEGEKGPGALLGMDPATGRILWKQVLGTEAGCPRPELVGRWVAADAGRDPADPAKGDNLVVFVDRKTGKIASSLKLPWSRGRLRSIRRAGAMILIETSSGIYGYAPQGGRS